MKKLLFLISLFTLIFNVNAKEIPDNANTYDLDSNKIGTWTILYNSDWEITLDIDSVEFYRIINFIKGKPSGKVHDFYKTGQKQWEGYLISDYPTDVFDDGKSIWYNLNSSIKTISNYKNDKLNGLTTYNDSVGLKFLSIKYKNGVFKELDYCQLTKSSFANILEIINNSDNKNSIKICQAVLEKKPLFFLENFIYKSILLNIISENYFYLVDYLSSQKNQLSSYNILSNKMNIESGLYINNLFGIHSLKTPYVDSSLGSVDYLKPKYDTILDIDNYLVLYNNIASNYIHAERYFNEYFGYYYDKKNYLTKIKEIINERSISIINDIDEMINDTNKHELIKISHLQRLSLYYSLYADPKGIDFSKKAFDFIKVRYDSSDFSFIISEFYLGKAYMYNYHYDSAAIVFTSIAERLIKNIDIYNSTLPNHVIDKIYNIALEMFNNLIASDAFNAYCYDLYSFIDSRELRKIQYRNKFLYDANDINYQMLSDSLNLIYKNISKCYELSNNQQKNFGLNLDQLILISRKLEIQINKYTSHLSAFNFDVDDITSKLNKDEVFVDIIKFTIDFNDSVPQWLPHYFVYVFKSDSLRSSSNYYNYYRNTDSLELNPVRGLDAMFFPIDYASNLDSIYAYYSAYTEERPFEQNFSHEDKIYGNICYQYFWSKLESDLEGVSTVYFSSEGVYSKINPNVLFDLNSSKFLVDKYDIVSVSSAEDFIKNKDNLQQYKRPNNPDAIFFGNPSFLLNDNEFIIATNENQSKPASQVELDILQRGMSFEDLPATQLEVDLISNNLKSKGWDVEVISGDDATETRVKSIEAPKILHIATHGFFFDDLALVNRSNMISKDNKPIVSNSMTRSGLIFSGAKNTMNGEELPNDNGWLNSYEASLLNLKGTELVVLSACKTGSGDVKNGKGVYGLHRAIRIAGAESLLMSMWEVDDKATQELMTYFYDYWIDKKLNKKEAFKQAQQKIRDEYKHPYYWGAFIMLGE